MGNLHDLHEALMEALHHKPVIFFLENVLVGLIGWLVLVSIGIPGLMIAKSRGWFKFRRREFEDSIIFVQVALRRHGEGERYILGLRAITTQKDVDEVFRHQPDIKAFMCGVKHTTTENPVIRITNEACRGRIHTHLRSWASVRNDLTLEEKRFLIAPTFERARGMESMHSRVMVLTPELLERILQLHEDEKLDLEAEYFEPLLDTLSVINNVYRDKNSPVFKAFLRLPTWE